MKEFKDKVAVVTGAASGIGRGMAEAFIGAGMKVVLSDIEKQALDETTRALREGGADVHPVVTDVTKAEQVDDLARETIRTYGAVHVLCNNAGIFIRPGASWTSSLDDWHWIIGVNVMGVVHGIRSFLPIMIEQNVDAHIVNTASVGGLVPGGHTLYGTTKYAVVGLSENLHLELQRGGLRPKVSVLCPNVVNTNILNSRRNQPAFADAPPAPTGAAAEALRQQAAALLKTALSPRVVGEQVLAGIRDERFYILTHPEITTAALAERLKQIIGGAIPHVR